MASLGSSSIADNSDKHPVEREGASRWGFRTEGAYRWHPDVYAGVVDEGGFKVYRKYFSKIELQENI
jgi:hypothetical protein